MTNYIGPIEITNPHIKDKDNAKLDGSEQINIVCSPEQAKQILGLCEDSVKNVYGNRRIITSKQSRWGILPIDTSENLKVNEAMTHKGFYQLLGEPEEIVLNPKVSRLNLPAEMISKNHNEILSILYGKGGEDGSDIEHTFEDNDIEILLDDTFDGLWSDYWTGYDTYNLTSHNVSTSGGKLVFTGTNGTSGFIAPWGGMNIESKSRYAPPWEVEFDMEYVSGTDHNLSVYIVEALPHDWSHVVQHSTDTNYIRIYLYPHDGNLYYAVQKCVRGVISDLKPETLLNISTEKNPSFKIGYYPGGGLEVYIDKTGAGTNYTKIWGRANIGLNWGNPGFMYQFNNMSSSSQTMKSSRFKLSRPVSAQYPNIVVAPPGAVCNETPTFTRTGEEGDIQCFKDPTVPINYQITPTDFYKGSVKGMNSNYSDDVARLVTHNDMDLDPTKFSYGNGLIKLVTTTNGVEYWYWNGTEYALLNTFTLPQPINLIRPFYVSKDVFTLQLDRTLWTIRAGKPFVYVEHPYDALSFTRKTCYYHDGVRDNGLAADADVSMLTQHYTLVFNAYNLLTEDERNFETGISGYIPQLNTQSATLSQVADPYVGTYAMRCVTSNVASLEGFGSRRYYPLPVTPAVGLNIYIRPYMKGTGTLHSRIFERDSSGAILKEVTSPDYTLTSTYRPYSFAHTITNPNTTQVSFKILTSTKQAADFLIDGAYIGPTPNLDSLITQGPGLISRYGMLIMKKDPTTIKSDSIPASEITGIGVYDQMQPATANDGFKSVAREWYKPTVQRLALQGVV